MKPNGFFGNLRRLLLFVLPAIVLIPSLCHCGETPPGSGRVWELYGGMDIFASGTAKGSVNEMNLFGGDEGDWSTSGGTNYAPSGVIGIRTVEYADTGGFYSDFSLLRAKAERAEVNAFGISFGAARRLPSGYKDEPEAAGWEPSFGAGILMGLGQIRMEGEEGSGHSLSVAPAWVFGLELYADAKYRFKSGKGVSFRYKLIPTMAAYNGDSIPDKEARAAFISNVFTVGYNF
ncbi:hypothetical protein EPN96_06225 [bacterium]|nr:MAG: hypothetical protein EPN96_06225 [bacterium]